MTDQPVSQAEDVVLKACPFCGSDETSHGYSFPPDQGYVECHACGGAVIKEYEAEAVAAWNRRAALTQTSPAAGEGVRPFGLSPLESERIRSDLVDGLEKAFWAGSEMAQGYDAVTSADAILAALQPQAQPAAPESEG